MADHRVQLAQQGCVEQLDQQAQVLLDLRVHREQQGQQDQRDHQGQPWVVLDQLE